MKKGKFVISLDTEIAWGRIEESNKDSYLPLFEKTREVVKRLVDVFDKYEIPATWAMVGRLIEDSDNLSIFSKMKIEDYYPSLTSKKIYEDSILNNESNSYVLAKEFMDQVMNAKVIHEIGTHSYHHILFGKIPKSDKYLVEKDVEGAKGILKKYGIDCQSVVFPRNLIGHLDVFQKNGINCYRGPDKFWFDRMPNAIKKPISLLNTFLPISPTVVDAENKNGMVNIPGSLFFRITHFGIKKNVPFSILEKKAIKGLQQASSQGKIFHLWFHPFNFGYKMDEHFNAFEKVLKEAKRLRDIGKIETQTMKTIKDEVLSIN